MPTPFALLLLALVDPTPRLAVISGDASTKDDLEGVLAGMKGVEEERELCPSQVLPPRRQ